MKIKDFEKVKYSKLNARQKESYNYHKVSARLADYGFTTIKLSDDWQGADFIAQHNNGLFLKIQLKGRLTLDKKYLGKDLLICFNEGDDWYIYPHDEIVALIEPKITGTQSWDDKGLYSWKNPTKEYALLLEEYKI